MTVGQTFSLEQPSTTPVRALHEVVTRQLSGRLTFTTPESGEVAWRIYIGNGNVHFATSTQGQQERLSYLLKRHYPQLSPLQLQEFPSDYEYLCSFWRSGQLSLQELRKLLLNIVQEACEHCLALPQVQIQFDRTVGLDPILISIPLEQAVTPVRSRVQQWTKLRAQSGIGSPFQRPYIENLEQFGQSHQQAEGNPKLLRLLGQALIQNRCLYEVAAELKVSPLKLAMLLHPWVQAGQIAINAYPNDQPQKPRPLVACIDDSHAVQRQVKRILELAGYQVLSLTAPTHALTAMIRHRPALILMDIAMPEIDGYELCRLFRQSMLLRETPIVMLTGRDGMIDRLRSRMVGATDHISKPFTPQHLLDLVEKSVSQAQLNYKVQ